MNTFRGNQQRAGERETARIRVKEGRVGVGVRGRTSWSTNGFHAPSATSVRRRSCAGRAAQLAGMGSSTALHQSVCMRTRATCCAQTHV